MPPSTASSAGATGWPSRSPTPAATVRSSWSTTG
jgi:hypothetical protein